MARMNWDRVPKEQEQQRAAVRCQNCGTQVLPENLEKTSLKPHTVSVRKSKLKKREREIVAAMCGTGSAVIKTLQLSKREREALRIIRDNDPEGEVEGLTGRQTELLKLIFNPRGADAEQLRREQEEIEFLSSVRTTLESTRPNGRLLRDLLTVGQFAGENYFFQGEMVLMLGGLLNAVEASLKCADRSREEADVKLEQIVELLSDAAKDAKETLKLISKALREYLP